MKMAWSLVFTFFGMQTDKKEHKDSTNMASEMACGLNGQKMGQGRQGIIKMENGRNRYSFG